MKGRQARRGWETLPPDPDLGEDLGYELLDLEVRQQENGAGVVFLPRGENARPDGAFIVAARTAVCDTVEWL